MCEGSHSDRAKAALSGLIVLFLALLLTANIPLAGFHKAVANVDDPIQAATGARQVWSVFAPDPNQVVASVAVRFVYRDGTSATWRIKRGEPLVHGYRDYRWLKLAENTARSDSAAAGLLVWAVRTQAGPKPLARAELVRSFYDIAPAGTPRGRHGPLHTGVVLTLRPSR